MHLVKSRLNCGCGGQYHLTYVWYGDMYVKCDRCFNRKIIKYTKKGGRRMPFPKDVKRPYEVPEIAILKKIEDFNGRDLMLRGTKVKENEQYGNGVVLLCEDENGLEVKILTFSQVIAEQLVALTDHLPLIIRPVNNGTYFTIY